MTVSQWQYISADPERAAAFYRDVFDWRVDNANALGYRQVAAADGGIGGGFWPAPPQAPSFVQLFIGTPDVAAAVERALAAGASVIVPPSVLPDGDVMAVLRDPLGVSFGLMQTAAP